MATRTDDWPISGIFPDQGAAFTLPDVKSRLSIAADRDALDSGPVAAELGHACILEDCNALRDKLYMILRFRHKGLERLFRSGDASGVNPQHARRLRQILLALNSATRPAGMDLPGLRLHPLRGEHRGQWAVSVSGNWRVVFEFDGPDATDIDLVDYH